MDPYNVLNYDSRNKDGAIPKIKIGKYCSIATNCTFILGNHLMDRVTTSPSKVMLFPHNQGNMSGFSRGDIIIGNDVWIGANSTILDNVTIGNGAVVSACSNVTKSVPPYAIVGGNPARVIKYRFSDKIIKDLENLKIWDLPNHIIDKLDLWTKNIEEFINNYQSIIDKLIIEDKLKEFNESNQTNEPLKFLNKDIYNSKYSKRYR